MGSGKSLLLIGLICLLSAALHAEVAPGMKVGDTAPAFALPDLTGRTLHLEAYRGKPVVLNFWAFWCDTWKAELPHLKLLAPRQEEIGFRLLAISVDGTRLPEFMSITRGKVAFPVLLDVGSKVSDSYGVAHVPTVIILDGQGIVRYTHIGYPGNEAVLHALRRITAGEAAPGAKKGRTNLRVMRSRHPGIQCRARR